MNVGVYSCYLDTFGGGEKYIMTVAEAFSRNNSVDVFLDNHLNKIGGSFLKEKLSKRFNLDLAKMNFIKAPFGVGTNLFERSIFLKKYDLIFYVTDGSVFYSTAKKSILHLQSPLPCPDSKSSWGKIKLSSWKKIVYNSEFTKKNSEKNWPIPGVVIYPPVDVSLIKPKPKRKMILSVGRFFGFLKVKKHEEMIKMFKQLYLEDEIKEWSLHLVGSAMEGDLEYVNKLKELAKGLPVFFYPNLGFLELVKLYEEASIYWHAAGYGESDPTKMEHFGITTVEAMAGGCVPCVVNLGGQPEIVENKISGYLWNDLDEFKKYTLILVNDKKLRDSMSEKAIQKAQDFSKKKFEQNVLGLI